MRIFDTDNQAQRDALTIALVVDRDKREPLSFFRLEDERYRTRRSRLAHLNLPMVFAVGSGSAMAEVTIKTENVLEGIENA